MDGIAIQYQLFEKGQSTFPIEGIAPAGSPQMTLKTGWKLFRSNDRFCYA